MTKIPLQVDKEKVDSSRRNFEIIVYPYGEKMKSYSYLTNTTNINFSSIKYLYGSGRYMEGGTGKYVYDLEVRKDFSNKMQKIQTTEKNTNDLSTLQFNFFELPVS